MVVSRRKTKIVAETKFKPLVLQESSRPEAPIQLIQADLTTFFFILNVRQHRVSAFFSLRISEIL